jgi:UDP-N-acetylglucosamine acyltransferase
MQIVGLNMVGLRRSGMPPNERSALRTAYQLLFRSHLNTTNALERISAEVPSCESVDYLVQFMRRTYGGRSGRQDQPLH